MDKMSEQVPPPVPLETSPAIREELWLLVQPTLKDYLDFVTDLSVEGANANFKVLTDEWREANEYYHDLEQAESGLADKVDCQDLPPALASRAAEVAADPHYRRTFNVVQTDLGMVELDKLVVFQKHVNPGYVDTLGARLGPDPHSQSLFQFCLPLNHPNAPVQIQQVGSRRYLFQSESTDFRYHESTLLRADQLHDYQSFGAIAGVVGLVVGFGSNFLNVIQYGRRLLLNNGYHRACALRQLGVTHAPCIIQTVNHLEELDVIAKPVIADDPEFYFHSARPPLLRDFFDPKIRKIVPVYKRTRMIEVKFEVRDYIVPETNESHPEDTLD